MGTTSPPDDSTSQDLPVLRYIADDDSTSADSLLSKFKESSMSEEIEAENDSVFARRAQEKGLEAIRDKAGTDMPALRVAGGMPVDAPDDEVWNKFQQSDLYERVPNEDKEEAESFIREEILGRTGFSSAKDMLEEQESEETPPEETELTKTRALLGDTTRSDEEIINEFRRSSKFDPESDLDPITQAEQFSGKALFTKVNRDVQEEEKRQFEQQGIDLAKDPEEQEKSWPQYLVDLFTPQAEKEEAEEEEPAFEKEIPTAIGAGLSALTGETGTPSEQIMKVLGNEDVETGSGALDRTARLLDIPFSATRFAQDTALRTAGTLLELGESTGESALTSSTPIGDISRSIARTVDGDTERFEPPKESYYDNDLADVPGVGPGDLPESAFAEDDKLKPSSELIMEANKTSNLENKKSLLRTAAMQRRKERYESLSTGDKTLRATKMLGRSFYQAFAGLPRQIGAIAQRLEQDIDPDPDENLDDSVFFDIADMGEHLVNDHVAQVRKDVKGGFFDSGPSAVGSMLGFVAASYLTGKAARFSPRGLRRSVSVGRGVKGGPVTRSTGNVAALGTDEAASIVGRRSVVTRGQGASQTATRNLIARNADDVEQALTVGGAEKFRTPQELSFADQNMIGATKTTPAIQGGGMIGWDAYERTKRIPDPSIYPDRIQKIIKKQEAGKELTFDENQKLKRAVEQRARDAFWTAAPGGWTEAVAGRVIDRWVENAAGMTSGIGTGAVKQGGTEFLQESLASAYSESANKATNNPGLDPFNKMFEEGLAGAFAGSLIGGAGVALGRAQSQEEHLELLAPESDRVPDSNLGQQRGAAYQKQRAREISESEDGEPSLPPSTFARTLSDLEEDGRASVMFELGKTESDQVTDVVPVDRLRDGDLDTYAQEPALRDQEQVGEAMGSVIDGLESLSEDEKSVLKSRIFFHDVNSRPLTLEEQRGHGVEPDAENPPHFTGVTYQNMFDESHFQESHVFADASRVDAFEELFHAIYDSSDEATKQRAVDAFNEVEDRNVESYEDAKEEIARRFAEEIDNQVDVEPTGRIREAINNIGDVLTSDNAVQKEVKDFLSGEADINWNAPITRENRPFVVVQPTQTHIETSEEVKADAPLGVYHQETEKVIERHLDRIENDNDPIFVIRTADGREDTPGVGRENLMETLRSKREEVSQEMSDEAVRVQAKIDPEEAGARKASKAAQEADTSEGLPDVDMPKSQIKSLGFNHENHAVNAVNKDRRQKGMPEYEEGETVPQREIIEAAEQPERIKRRIAETGQVPSGISVRESGESVASLDRDQLLREERRVRAWVRDVEVIEGGEQALIKKAREKIRMHRAQARELEEGGDYVKAEKKRRFADAVERGLNDRVSKRQRSPDTDQEFDIERTGIPRLYPSTARIPTWAETLPVPGLNSVLIWDPTMPDPTGRQQEIEESGLGAITGQAEFRGEPVQEGQLPEVPGGDARVVGTNALQRLNLERGDVLRVTEQDTVEVNGREIPVRRVHPDDADRLGISAGDPVAENLEGTWIRTEDLVDPNGFINQLQQDQREAEQDNRTGRVQQVEDIIENVQTQMQSLSQRTETDETLDLDDIDRIDPTDVPERTGMGQVAFDLGRARDFALAGQEGEARRILLDTIRRVRENDDLQANLFEPNARENETIEAIRAAEIAESVRSILDQDAEPVGNQEEFIPASNQTELQEAFEEVGIDPVEAEAAAAAFDARAEAFASQTGLTKSDWYQSRIAGISSETLGNEALNQIRAYHGTIYDFPLHSQFSLEYIGEGEGFQTFGWGLYFTEDEIVARQAYADRLWKQKGEAEWTALDGQYTIRREVGEPQLRIIGPDGNELTQIEPSASLLTTDKLKLIITLNDARRFIGEHASERGVTDQDILERFQNAEGRAIQAEQNRKDVEASIKQSNVLVPIAREIRNIMRTYSDEQVESSIETWVSELLADIRKEYKIGIDPQSYIDEDFGFRTWLNHNFNDSDLLLTAQTEYDITGQDLEDLIREISDLTQNIVRTLDGSGYRDVVRLESNEKGLYNRIRENFSDEIDISLVEKNRFAAEVVLHEGRSPDEYNYARWRNEPEENVWDAFEGVLDRFEEGDVSAQHGISISDLRNAVNAAREWDGEGRAPSAAGLVISSNRSSPRFKDIYKHLHERTSATPQDVSLALLEEGVDGIVFRGDAGQGDYDNYVVFDDSVISIESAEKFQKRSGNITGAIDFVNDHQAVISLLEGADIDTVMEEFGHLLLEDMPLEDRQIVAERLRGELGDDSINVHNLRSHREAHEQFADWFRRYVREGTAPDTTLERIMAKLQDLMKKVWNRIAPSDWATERVPADVRATMDRLFRPDDPRAQLVEEEGDPSSPVPGLEIQEDGTRAFYPEAYKEWVFSEEGNEMHGQLTPSEFEAYQEIANTNLTHQAATRQALQEGKDVPTASLIEYIENAPVDNESAAEMMNAERVEDFGEPANSEIREGVPEEIGTETDIESDAEVGDEGFIERDIDEDNLRFAGVRSGPRQNERNLERARRGKSFWPGSDGMEYVTPTIVEEAFEVARAMARGERGTYRASPNLGNIEEIREAIRSDEFMSPEEMRAFSERDSSFDEMNTQEQRERHRRTMDKINDLAGDDHSFRSLEGLLKSAKGNIRRQVRKSHFYLQQHQVARSQPDYEGEEGVDPEVREALEEIDLDNPFQSLEDQRKFDKAKNDDLSWQEQGEDFTDIVEWFEEFWLRQSGRKVEDKGGVVALAEEHAGNWIEGDDAGRDYIEYEDGVLTVTFDQRGDIDAPNTVRRAGYAWQSLSMKERKGTPEDLNGGVMQVERGLHQEGIQDRGVLVTPNFAIEMRKMADGTYRFVMREPTSDELDISRTERDKLRWQNKSDFRARSLTEAPSDFYHDTFGVDEGQHTMEDKLNIFTAERPTYRVNENLVLTERSAVDGRSDAEKIRFSAIVPEAQGPVGLFYDSQTGELAYSTDQEVADAIEEEHGSDIREAIEDIREQDREGPDLFGDEQVTSTENVQDNTQEYVEGLLDMLGLDQRVAIINPSDVDPDNPGPFTGDHRAGRLVPHDALNEKEGDPTWIGEFGNGDYYIVVQEFGSDAYKSEAIAHEIGHLVFNEVLNSNEHTEARQTLKEEHNRHLEEIQDMTVGDFVEQFMSYHRLKASEYLDSVKDLTMQELEEHNPQMFNYLIRFDEWIAEQTARYVTTEDAVGAGDSVVRRLYNELAQFFRDIYKFVMENGFGPNVKFAEWVEHHMERKEYDGRIGEVKLALNGTPYQQEIWARQAIENAKDTIPENIRSDIRGAVKNDEVDITEVIEPLPQDQQVPATRYARGFQNVIRAQNREFPSDASAYVTSSYAISHPTPNTGKGRFREFVDRFIPIRSPEEGAYLNSWRRKYYTGIHRQLRLLSDKYPALDIVLDQVFAAGDQVTDVETLEEGKQKARNRFGTQLADILRRIRGTDSFKLGGDAGWTQAADRVQEVVDIIQRRDVDAHSESSIREVTNDDRTVRGALEMREFFDDFFEYLVDRGALAEDARLDNYFPQSLNVNEVLRSPEEFKQMLVRQMEKRAAENQGEDPETFQFEGESLVNAEELAENITDVVTNVEDEFTVDELLRQEDMRMFANRLDLKPSAMHSRHLLFLDHSDAEVKQFYNKDPIEAMWTYVNGGIKFAEYAKRFGPNNEKIEGVFEILDANNATYTKRRLRGLLLSVKGNYTGWVGKGYFNMLRYTQTPDYIGKATQAWRNATTALMLQFTGLTSTAPEALALPARVGVTRTAKALPEGVFNWLKNGMNELHQRSKQRLGTDSGRKRDGIQRIMSESASLSDRAVDSLMRSRVMSGSGVQSEMMKWFFNINILRPIQRLFRTVSSVAGKNHILDALENADRDSRLMSELEHLGLPTNREARRGVADVIDRMTKGEEAAWQTEEADRFLTAMQRLAQQTVVESNPASRPLWMNDKNPLMRLAGQFKGFTTAFREGPLAYMSRETIQNFGEGNVGSAIRQSGRMAAIMIAMGMAATMGDWLRHEIYYNMSEPKQREAWRSQRNQLNLHESLESLQHGEFGRAADQMSGLPRIVERMGVLGTATHGSYFPITSVRNYDSNYLVELGGPGVSLANDIIQSTVKGRPGNLYDNAVQILPGGQAMRYREQYKDWISQNVFTPVGLANDHPVPMPEERTEDGTEE